MSLTKQIFLNTRDRSEGSNASACWNIIDMMDVGGKLMSILQVEFPNQMYPFNASRQNYVVYFQENNDTGTTLTAPITLGTDYNGTSLATELSTILTANSGNAYTYTVTYDSISKKLTINSTGVFRLVDGQLTANAELGYNTSIDYLFVTNRTLSDPVNLSGTAYVDVISSYAGNSSFNTTGQYSTLARITVVASFGEIVLFQNQNKQRIPMPYGVTNIELSLRDDRGYIIELGSNGYASYTLLFE